MASFANSSVLLLAVMLAAVAAADAATFTVINKCGYTVWPAALPSGEGTQLEPGQSWTIHVPAGTRGGRVWGRTGCGFVSGSKLGQCQTGDCGGVLRCRSLGAPPITVAEFALGVASGSGGEDYFDISLVDGFNAPMSFQPAGGSGGVCPRGGPSCVAEITLQCPGELRAKAGCSNPCRGNSSCGPTKDTEFFKQLCPETITYARDDRDTTFTCPAGHTDYQIVFCP